MIFKEFKNLLKRHYLLWNKRLKENEDLSLLTLKAGSFYHTTVKRLVYCDDHVTLFVGEP